jgi:hypothetical protein
MKIDYDYKDVDSVDFPCSDEVNVKIIESHSNFTDHPYDLGLLYHVPPEMTTIFVFEEYEKGLVILER